MHTKSILAMLMMTVASLTFSYSAAEAANVDVHVSGYLPAPPGVIVRVDAGRPYYVEHERRVYIERERPRHYKGRHYRKEKRQHDDNGNHYGNDKHEGRGHGH